MIVNVFLTCRRMRMSNILPSNAIRPPQPKSQQTKPSCSGISKNTPQHTHNVHPPQTCPDGVVAVAGVAVVAPRKVVDEKMPAVHAAAEDPAVVAVVGQVEGGGPRPAAVVVAVVVGVVVAVVAEGAVAVVAVVVVVVVVVVVAEGAAKGAAVEEGESKAKTEREKAAAKKERKKEVL